MKFFLAIIFACLFFFISCHKDIDYPEVITTTKFTAEILEEINGDILGYVLDENNQPVEGAFVQIYSDSTTTNKYGVFSFKNSKLDKNGTYLTVRKQGYFLGSDMIYPNKAESNSMVKLMKLETGKFFDATNGGIISIRGGGSIDFPADAISYKDGTPYNGVVSVSAKLLSPTNPELSALMPGGLIGDQKNKATVVLGTAGMIAIELRDDKGKALNLGAGKKANLTIPALSQSKPNTILLWSFDESKGRWQEEGIATLRGSNYIAEVSHFSFWNCDAPFPLINVCGKVIDNDGNVVKNAWIFVETEGLGSSYGTTDREGIFCGKMPKGKVLTIKVNVTYGCGEPILIKTLGPFDNNTQLDPFTLADPANKLVLKGKVTCDGVLVDDAMLIVKSDQWSIPIRPNADGSFNENLSHLFCQGLTSVDVFAFDQSTLVASSLETIKFNEDKSLVLNVCGSSCPIEGKFNYDCKTNALTISATNGSGTYTYKWSNGGTTNTTKVTTQDTLESTFCVAVTDVVNGCSKEFCINYGGTFKCFIEGWCSPSLNAKATGGFPPYSFKWSDGRTTQSIGDLTAGNYIVTVTDAQGCTTIDEILVAGEFLFVSETPSACNKNYFSLVSSNFIQAYLYTQNGVSINQPILSELDLFVTGFNFSILMGNTVCERTFSIKLPQLKSLEAIPTNTTCATCKDGYITVTNSAECYQCTLGNIKILGEDKVTDYTTENTSKSLKSGLYYIVAEDLNSGCYIGISKVNVK